MNNIDVSLNKETHLCVFVCMCLCVTNAILCHPGSSTCTELIRGFTLVGDLGSISME